MRGFLVFACLLPAAAQAQISQPAPAVYRDLSGRMAILTGIPGAWSTVRAEGADPPEAGADAGAPAEWISPGVLLLRGAKDLWVWTPETGAIPIPAEAPPPLELLWRETSLVERPVNGEFELPPTPPGSSSSARFRIRNNTAESINVTRLSVDPGAFRTFDQFFPPHTILAGGYADFSIRFAPEALGTYSSTLYINTLRFTLRGVSEAMPELEVLDGADWHRLDPASPFDLGSVERRSTIDRLFRVILPPGAAPPASSPSLSGNGFALVSPGANGFMVRFSGESAGSYSATIALAGRSYTLTARVLEFKAPRPVLDPAVTELESAKPQKLMVRFDEAARADFPGTLKLTFRPDVQGVASDPAVTFLPEQRGSITFWLRTGSSLAEFSNGADYVFLQTGTTAGTITVTLAIDQYLGDTRFRVLPAVVGLTAAKADFSDVNARITLTGFDNTRSASKIAFTFFLKDGQAAAPGRIEADISGSFKSYFSENPAAAGAWQLKALFPVSGSSDLLDSVEVEIANSQGTRRTDRLRFE